MNWFKKAQSLQHPQTYMDIGHGYHQISEERKAVWRIPDVDEVMLWWFENGKIQTILSSRSHAVNLVENAPSQGRVDMIKQQGSISFSLTIGNQLKKQIIQSLIDKFPGIKFFVFERGGPFSLQDYWERSF